MKKELEYYGGFGWMDVILKKGDTIEIGYGANDITKTFTDTAKAVEYYDSINDEKFAWQISPTGFPELIEAHIIKTP